MQQAQRPAQPSLRLGELIAALSLAFDLGNNAPFEKALRNALLAVGIGRELGLEGQTLSDVYYVAQLRYLGCTAFSYELAGFLGVDELQARGAYSPVLTGSRAMAVRITLTQLGRDAPLPSRFWAMAKMALGANQTIQRLWRADCEAATRLASQLGMSEGVCLALDDVASAWNGAGLAKTETAGEAIPLSARIAFLAHQVETHHRHSGRAAAIRVVRTRAGRDFDPAVAGAFLARAADLFESIEPESVWDAALEAEPEPWPWIPSGRLDAVAQAFGNFVDLKSPYTLGHSAGVAALAAAAGQAVGLKDDEVIVLRRAGWVHDLGRVSVPNTIWDKPGPLTVSEWERVRLHPYHSERILSRAEVLRPLALIGGMHHERLNGAGYHRGTTGLSISSLARLLAAADAYQAMTEPRPHRPALTPTIAGRELAAEVEKGRLDREAVRAVLDVTGQAQAGRRLAWPANLSEREVQVLRLAARGRPNREIAELLYISENTVHHHVKRIYDKIGVATRAGAALFAMEHGLLPAESQETT